MCCSLGSFGCPVIIAALSPEETYLLCLEPWSQHHLRLPIQIPEPLLRKVCSGFWSGASQNPCVLKIGDCVSSWFNVRSLDHCHVAKILFISPSPNEPILECGWRPLDRLKEGPLSMGAFRGLGWSGWHPSSRSVKFFLHDCNDHKLPSEAQGPFQSESGPSCLPSKAQAKEDPESPRRQL